MGKKQVVRPAWGSSGTGWPSRRLTISQTGPQEEKESLSGRPPESQGKKGERTYKNFTNRGGLGEKKGRRWEGVIRHTQNYPRSSGRKKKKTSGHAQLDSNGHEALPASGEGTRGRN